MSDEIDKVGDALEVLGDVRDGDTTALARFVRSGEAMADALRASPVWGPRMAAVKARREAERAAELAANRAHFLNRDHEFYQTRFELMERLEALAAEYDPEDFRQACWLLRHHGVKP